MIEEMFQFVLCGRRLALHFALQAAPEEVIQPDILDFLRLIPTTTFFKFITNDCCLLFCQPEPLVAYVQGPQMEIIFQFIRCGKCLVQCSVR